MTRAESGSITKLGNNRWRVRVSGGNDPVTGKRIRKTKVVHGTKKDAIAERTRMQVEVGDVSRATKDMTIEAFVHDVFLPWHRENVRVTTYKTTEGIMRNHVVPGIGHIKLNKLSPYTIETFIASLATDSIRHEAFRVARQAYKQAYKWDLVTRNLFDKLDAPKRHHSEKVVADAELAALIIEAFHGDRIEAPFLLEISCGLRKSEALALDWEDIDFASGKVRIHRTYQYVSGEGCRFFDVKTQKSRREVAVPRSILSRLQEIRCSGGVIRKGPLSIGLDGDRLSPDSYKNHYKHVYSKKLHDQPYITLKNLRHSHATILTAAGTDIKTVSERLGHASINVTASIYAQHVSKLDEDASDAFDAAIRVASPRSDVGNVVELRSADGA